MLRSAAAIAAADTQADAAIDPPLGAPGCNSPLHPHFCTTRFSANLHAGIENSGALGDLPANQMWIHSRLEWHCREGGHKRRSASVVTRWLRVVYDTRRLSAHGTQRRNTAESTHKTATAIAVTAFTNAPATSMPATRPHALTQGPALRYTCATRPSVLPSGI